jgi:hypothetical protein
MPGVSRRTQEGFGMTEQLSEDLECPKTGLTLDKLRRARKILEEGEQFHKAVVYTDGSVKWIMSTPGTKRMLAACRLITSAHQLRRDGRIDDHDFREVLDYVGA